MQISSAVVFALGVRLVASLLPVARGEDKLPNEAETRKLLESVVSNHLSPPAGRTAVQMLPIVTGALGSPDPYVRDDVAFTILSSWIYEKQLLGPDELRPLVAQLLRDLRTGIGGERKDDVLRRSFSALTLSVIVARDNKQPFLSEEEFRRVLDGALSYFADERDTRGFDETKGWIHTVAHTSDLLKFLARSRNLPVPEQTRIFQALGDKLHAVTNGFEQGEDERMAWVVISLLHRPDADMEGFRRWLDARKLDSKFPTQVNLTSLRLMQNTRRVLTSLWAEMSVDKQPFEKGDEINAALKSGLAEML